MKPPFHRYICWRVAATALCLLLRTFKATAQDETHWLTLKNPNFFTEMDVESESVSESVGGQKYTSYRLYLAPTAGLDLSGSIYHPNLLQFNLSGQGGYISDDVTVRSDGTKSTSHQDNFLQNYNLDLLFLSGKPYAAGFTAIRTHNFEELDAFNQAIVDSESYAGHMGYTAGPVPFTVAVKHLDETESGIQYNSTYKQDDVALSAQNSRTNGSTTFSYNFGHYNENTAGATLNESYQYGNLLDSERFGRDNHLDTSANFNQQSSDSSQSGTIRNVTLQENLILRNNQHWDSFANYNFDDYYADPAETYTHYVTVGAHNQLFQSLSSEFDLHGSLQDASAPGSTASASMYGIGNSETYNKQLGDWGRLTLGNVVRYDLQHEDNAGATVSIFGEQHVLKDGTPVFLTQPLVTAVTRVTDPTGSRIYIKGVDYTDFQAGQLTQIERIPTSLSLTNGATVLVNYIVQSQPSGSYTTFTEECQVRLDLFNGLLDVYSGLGSVANHSTAPFVLENTFNTQSGADFTWHWLRAGGDYETESGNLIKYNALSAYQTGTWQASSTGAVSVNGRERWAQYPQEHMNVDDYTLTTRFTDQFGRRLTFSVEAGIWNEQGGPMAQTLLTAGTQVKYNIGKLFLSLAYQFNQQDTISGENLRNFVSFTARRDF